MEEEQQRRSKGSEEEQRRSRVEKEQRRRRGEEGEQRRSREAALLSISVELKLPLVGDCEHCARHRGIEGVQWDPD